MDSESQHEGLRLQAVEKSVGDFLLRADFDVHSGERVALIGRSGSGKTTLFRMIAGLDSPDRGKISLAGEEITGLSPQRRGIGVVFQEHALFSSLNVLENAAFGLQMKKVSREEREAEALRWLEKVGLKARARDRIDRLSGGESQRVAFVRALIWKPRLLLLDEPFSSLDPEMRKVLRAELLSLHQLWPVPLVLVSHDEADREAIATRQLQLRETDQGTVRSVTSN